MSSLFDLFDQPQSSVDLSQPFGAPDVVIAAPDVSSAVVEIEPDQVDTSAAPSDERVVEQIEPVDDAEGVPFSLTSEAADQIYSNATIVDEAYRWFKGARRLYEPDGFERDACFPYRELPLFVMMQQINRLALAPEGALSHTSEAYSVADTFHPHRFHATVLGKVSPVQCFNDEVKFRHALSLRLDRGNPIPAGFFGEITLSRGTQQCSNFRPGFACLLYRRYCKPGDTVLDTSTGYGGRLVGYIASMVRGRYIGIDPNTMTHRGNLAMAQALGVASQVELHNLPAEDVDHALVANRCQFAFTSPPYFSKEHYSDEPTQSWKRYGHAFEAWVDGFLRPMLALTFAALTRGSLSIINIEDVTIKTTRYKLVEATIAQARAVGFTHVATELFEMQQRVGANQADEVATERVLIFRKP